MDEFFNLMFKGFAIAILTSATFFMLRESTFELRYLMKAWNDGALKYKVIFLLFVILMYFLSLCPIAMGILFVIFKGKI